MLSYRGFLFHLKRYPRLPCNIQQILHHRLDKWNAFSTSDRLRFSLRVAGDQWAVGAGCGLGVSKDVNPFVDLLFEFIFLDEAVDLHGAEEVADAFADAALGDFLSQSERRREGAPIRAAQYAAQDVHH